MFDFLKSIVPAKAELDKTIAKDAIAEMLRTSPEKLAEFEASYRKHALDVEPKDDLFHMNSRQMSEKRHRIDPDAIEKTGEDVTDLIDRIVDELLADTIMYEYDGVSTTNEWVVREFIEDKEGNPCIYKGLPLHTEYRVFVDCDVKTVLGITPYWEPETMKQRFGHEDDADSPHQIHDYIVYKSHEDVLMNRYEANKQKVLDHVREILPGLDLHGQWSIDVMQNGDEFWVIDMALAENSAFYKDCVPEELRAPQEEDWIPAIGQPD